MELKFSNDKNEWNSFLIENSGSFLQSFEWGELQEKSSKKVFRLKVYEGSDILVQAQVIKEGLLFKNYLYIPYGPIFKNNLDLSRQKACLKILIDGIQELASEENSVFLRIEPLVPLDKMIEARICRPFRRIQPQKTLILDLTKTEEELFKNLSSGSRRNISIARRDGVVIEKQKDYSPDFYRLLKGTKERQEFSGHAEEYYKNILKIDGEFVKTELFLARYKDRIINATIVVFFNKKAFTLHSGSDYEYRHVKGSNLLRWNIISEAKKMGMQECDFWGIDEKKWPDLTSFKKGFGGREVEYPAGLDMVFQGFWYNAYRIIKFIRRII